MEVKLIRVLDRATDIGVLLTHFSATDGEKYPTLKKAGYIGEYILYQPLDGEFRNRVTYDPYSWGDRTHSTAHLWISRKKWEEIPEIVDVEEILNEKQVVEESKEFEEKFPGFPLEELKEKIFKFLTENALEQDVSFHSQYEWEVVRGETLCKGAVASLTFEGNLYHAINYGSSDLAHKGISAILAEYGLYYELGYAWSMHFYKG